jgi:hypothetical protein
MRVWVVIMGAWALGMTMQGAFGQRLYVKGLVSEAGTGEPLPSVTVSDSSRQYLGSTNRYGYFNLALDRRPVTLTFSMVGYEPKSVLLDRDTVLTIALDLPTLREVEVKGSSQPLTNANAVTITPALLRRLPSIGGERDLLKAISLFSGVLPGSELSSGINVRGGANDQNLFQLDGAPIYSTGHLFGFLSIFNPDAIRKVDFYKGDFPVEFGGRLSSVTDVAFREGNKTRWEAEGELGVISSKLLLEGPLLTNKTSVLLAARSAYLNLFNLGKRQAVLDRRAENYFGYNFYDLNVKINHSFNPNHKLFLSYYRGVDTYETLDNSRLGINVDQNRRRLTNQLLSVRSYHVLGANLFLQTGLHATEYAYRYDEGSTQFRLDLLQPNPSFEPERLYTKIGEAVNQSQGSIRDVSGNLLAEWVVSPRVRAKAGAEWIYHRYQPLFYQLRTLDQDSLRLREAAATATEGGYFGSVMVGLSDRWQLNVGGRYSTFHSGSSTYGGLEPRLSLNYRADHTHLQLSAARMMQYNHALVNAGGLVDKTMWVPSTGRILPQSSWQYAAGWTQSFPSSQLRYQVGAYYKQMQNLSMYRYYIGDPYVYYNWEASTLSGGDGRTYGLELTASQSLKKLELSANYTLSWSQQRFAAINKGDWFNFLYDRRHSFNVNGLYTLRHQVSLSVLWMYYTGQRYNAPVGRIYDHPLGPGYVVYDGINNGQLPAYHRLDASLSKKISRPDNRFWEVSLNIYNVYSRRNTYRLYPATEVIVDDQQRPVGSRYVMKSASVFPILPSVSVRYKFR